MSDSELTTVQVGEPESRPFEGKFTIEADTILLAAGMRADQETVNELRDHAKWFVTVGDCVKAGKVFDAVNGGYYAALYI